MGTNHFQFRSHQFVRWGGVLTGDVSGFIDFLPYRGRRRFGRWCRGFFLSPCKGDGDHDERGGGKEGYLHLSVPFRFGVTQTPARVSRPDRFTRGRLQGEDRPYFATSYSVKADLALAQVAARNVRCQTPASARVLVSLLRKPAGLPRATCLLTPGVRFSRREYAHTNNSNLDQQRGGGADYGSSDEPYVRSERNASDSRSCVTREPGPARFVALRQCPLPVGGGTQNFRH